MPRIFLASAVGETGLRRAWDRIVPDFSGLTRRRISPECPNCLWLDSVDAHVLEGYTFTLD